MSLRYTIDSQGILCPDVKIEGKNSVPVATFLDDARHWTDVLLYEIDQVLAGSKELYEWSGNQSFATIDPENSLLEAQWIMDASGTELGETLPTVELRSLVEEWGKILHRSK